MQCDAVWCSVVQAQGGVGFVVVQLQCVAACCSVLQYGAVCCSVLQCDAVWCSVLQAQGRVGFKLVQLQCVQRVAA